MPKKYVIANYFASVLAFALLSACGGGGEITNSAALPISEVSPPAPPVPVALEQLRIFVIGQSISSNCNEFKFGPVDNVFQVGRDGDVKPASDPFEWADCSNGSMWMPLGKILIERGIAKKVVFMPIGVGGTKVRDWQEGGVAFPKLNAAIAQIKSKELTFDVALWHQGSSDIGTDKNEYLTRLNSVVSYINSNVTIGRWVIAQHSRCSGSYDKDIEEAQRAFANVPGVKRFVGPNNNLLGNEYRLSDACHLNELGQKTMASMWFDSIKSALADK